jgi:hypothetical protein
MWEQGAFSAPRWENLQYLISLFLHPLPASWETVLVQYHLWNKAERVVAKFLNYKIKVHLWNPSVRTWKRAPNTIIVHTFGCCPWDLNYHKENKMTLSQTDGIGWLVLRIPSTWTVFWFWGSLDLKSSGCWQLREIGGYSPGPGSGMWGEVP